MRTVVCGLSAAWLVAASAIGGAAGLKAAERANAAATGPLPTAVQARIPAPWAMPQDRAATIDFAESAQADAWLRHVVLGDPSFDSFLRRPGNPVVRGKPPFAWPVNGFLFEDPRSGNWYSYVGHYMDGYAFGPGLPVTHCRVSRSKDRGKTWEELGPIFRDAEFHFEGDAQPVTGRAGCVGRVRRRPLSHGLRLGHGQHHLGQHFPSPRRRRQWGGLRLVRAAGRAIPPRGAANPPHERNAETLRDELEISARFTPQA